MHVGCFPPVQDWPHTAMQTSACCCQNVWSSPVLQAENMRAGLHACGSCLGASCRPLTLYMLRLPWQIVGVRQVPGQTIYELDLLSWRDVDEACKRLTGVSIRPCEGEMRCAAPAPAAPSRPARAQLQARPAGLISNVCACVGFAFGAAAAAAAGCHREACHRLRAGAPNNPASHAASTDAAPASRPLRADGGGGLPCVGAVPSGRSRYARGLCVASRCVLCPLGVLTR